MSLLGALRVRLTADTSDLESGLKRAGQSIQGVSRKARTGINVIGKWGAAAAAAAAVASAAVVRSSVSSTREMANQANAANASVESFQRQAYAAESAGISQEKYADILKDVNDRVGDFLTTGAGPMADFFERIAPKVGVTAENFRNLSGPQALQLYVSSLEKANLSQAEMTFFMEAMASDSTRLIPLLKNGGEQMAAMGDEAERLGIVLSEIEVREIENAAKAMDRVGALASGAADQFTAELAPIIEAVADRLIEMAEEAGGVGNVFEDVVDGIVTGVGVIADAFRGWQLIVKTLQVALGTFASAAVRVLKLPLDAIQVLIDGTVAGVNQVIGAINKIPGVDVDIVQPYQLKSLEFMNDLLTSTRAVTGGFREELIKLAGQELPSDQLEAFVAKARKAAEAAAMEAPEEKEQNGKGGPVSKYTPEENQKFLEGLQERFATEAELIDAKMQSDIERLQEFSDKELEVIGGREAAKTKIERDAAKAREKIQEQEMQAKLQVASSIFSNLSSLMNTESKKMFKIGKAAAIAGALVDGYAAVVGAYKVGSSIGGPIVGAAYAATAAVATAAQIQKIKSQQFGAAGNPTTFNEGQPAINTGGGVQPQGGGGANGGGRSISINLQGSNFTSEQVRALIGQINQEVGDGVNLATGG